MVCLLFKTAKHDIKFSILMYMNTFSTMCLCVCISRKNNIDKNVASDSWEKLYINYLKRKIGYNIRVKFFHACVLFKITSLLRFVFAHRIRHILMAPT